MEVAVSKIKILIVDDELIMRESLAGWLERDGHAVQTAASGEEALEKVKETQFDIFLVDIKMEGISGLEVLRNVKESDPDADVVMITAYGSIPSAIEAMKDGAYDYMLKPFDPNELGVLIEKIIAPMDSTVLITGETGTGKGLAAKAIHTNSSRRDGPFVTVNCGAIPEHLMETELFGHQKGAFTDAKETKKGRLELAHGGTLFLDEIGEISMRMQIDLLRVLEDRIFYRVGGTQPIEADFRVIAATNRNLEKAIKAGIFREDLFYRLNVISFEMPSLIQRKEDIPLLAEHFLYRFAQETNKLTDKISREAMDEMMLYDWPGNIRELENAIERSVVVGKQREILPEDLPIFCHEPTPQKKAYSLKEVEKAHIQHVLVENQWNIARSAKLLGIDRSTLYSKIKRYNINKVA
jgi:DNA-binding NtrC family response regulator